MINFEQNCFKLNEIEVSNTGDVTFLTLFNRIWFTLHMFNRIDFPTFSLRFYSMPEGKLKFRKTKSPIEQSSFFPKIILASKCSRRSILAANEVSKAEEIGKRPFG